MSMKVLHHALSALDYFSPRLHHAPKLQRNQMEQKYELRVNRYKANLKSVKLSMFTMSSNMTIYLLVSKTAFIIFCVVYKQLS